MRSGANCSYTTGFYNADGMVFDPSSGALYVANRGTSTLCRITPGGGASACVIFAMAWYVRELVLMPECVHACN